MHNDESRHTEYNDTLQYVSLYDPFVYQTLQSVQGSMVVVQTCQGNIRGRVAEVKPDHVVIDSDGVTYFIRTQQIIWVMPQ
ncbi:YuzF family protein [Salipaludibacillus sp. LMS25]|jgi:hypothetical protein|uniref:YuzF family protein n=1 Tax=Salipaludibacillus sp. LMS25 TaxID=2924031 RepID=UPI0020D042D9|nr:YuzF family protein [Salipaludibacillus sp. LMS25]UTR15725.1 YuzF family protein [Salipaludibacillus sp. LMS25]